MTPQTARLPRASFAHSDDLTPVGFRCGMRLVMWDLRAAEERERADRSRLIERNK